MIQTDEIRELSKTGFLCLELTICLQIGSQQNTTKKQKMQQRIQTAYEHKKRYNMQIPKTYTGKEALPVPILLYLRFVRYVFLYFYLFCRILQL